MTPDVRGRALIGAAVVLGGPAGAAAPKVAGSLTLSDATVTPASMLTLTGVLPPRRSRTVKLQHRLGGSWVVLATQKSSSTGTLTFSTKAASAAGQRAYRVLAPATTLGGRRYAALVAPTRTVTVVTITKVDAGGRHGRQHLWTEA